MLHYWLLTRKKKKIDKTQWRLKHELRRNKAINVLHYWLLTRKKKKIATEHKLIKVAFLANAMKISVV